MKRPVKVLLVDDSRLVRERLASLVTELPGVELVGQAGGVAEAIRKIHKLRPQIVVLDISLADGTGLQVLQGIRNRRPFPCVIMLTNFTQAAYREKCFKLGAEHFFDKSAQFENAVEVLREMGRAHAPKSTKVNPAATRRVRKGKSEVSMPSRLGSDLCVLSGCALYCLISSAAAGPLIYAAKLLASSNNG